jgi:hypothetical protein
LACARQKTMVANGSVRALVAWHQRRRLRAAITI